MGILIVSAGIGIRDLRGEGQRRRESAKLAQPAGFTVALALRALLEINSPSLTEDCGSPPTSMENRPRAVLEVNFHRPTSGAGRGRWELPSDHLLRSGAFPGALATARPFVSGSQTLWAALERFLRRRLSAGSGAEAGKKAAAGAQVAAASRIGRASLVGGN